MASRSIEFTTGEYYHVYNRGTERRLITQDNYDSDRFIECLVLMNTEIPIGSVYEHALRQESSSDLGGHSSSELVEIVCYCLNPNHYHFILRQIVDDGISTYMQRLGTTLSKYFNNKYKRTGPLFEGKFKAKHIADNDYLLHTSAYVNLNDKVHKISGHHLQLVRSSWDEYVHNKDGPASKDIILDQFKSVQEYKRFAEESLELMLSTKEEQAELKSLEFF